MAQKKRSAKKSPSLILPFIKKIDHQIWLFDHKLAQGMRIQTNCGRVLKILIHWHITPKWITTSSQDTSMHSIWLPDSLPISIYTPEWKEVLWGQSKLKNRTCWCSQVSYTGLWTHTVVQHAYHESTISPKGKTT